MTGRDAEASRALWLLGCSGLIAAALTFFARLGPEPRPASAPVTEFSQARALRVLQLVAGDGEPRTPGSEASGRTLARLSNELERLGLAPEHQRTFVCAAGACGYVDNLLARVAGSEPGDVLVTAHHDSVGAGPGASDDGVGVAVVFETLRALVMGPPLRHGVIALIADAEEVGSLGATAFASEHAWMKEVRAVVNVDNGGTTGLCLMHGTGPGDLGVVELYARAVLHPASSSVFPVAQQFLPRFNDFGVFRRLRLPGLDFGFAAGATRYHTRLDSIEHSDPRSLQHEGESVLGSVRALTVSDLDALVTREAVWFDLFGSVVVRWSAASSLVLALIAFALLGFSAERERPQLLATAIACGAAFATTVSSGAAAWAVQWSLDRAGLLPATFVAAPEWLFIAMLSLALLCTLGVSSALTRFEPRSLTFGVWFAWAIGAMATAVAVPGASVLFVPVLLMAAGAQALFGRSQRGAVVAPAAAGLAASVIWFPDLAIGPDAFGISTLAVLAAPAGWLASLALPSFAALSRRARRRLWLTAIVALLLSVGVHALAPKFDARSPQRVNVIASTDTAAARSFAIVDTSWLGPRGVVPASMSASLATLANEKPYEASPFEWRAASALIAPLANVPAQPVSIDVQPAIADSQTTTLHVRLARAVRRLNVFAADSAPIRGLRFDTHPWPASVQPGRAGLRFRVWTLYAPMGEAVLSVDWDRPRHPPTKLWLVTESAGVPEAFQPLVQARPAWASPSQFGDRTVVSTSLRL